MKFINLSLTDQISESLSLKAMLAPKIARKVTTPYRGISKSVLKHTRLALAIVETIIWAYTTTAFSGDYIFYYSNWGNTLTMITLWLLVASHYTKNPHFHESVATTFEVAITMEFVINPIYWSLLYEPELFDPSVFSSYKGPYMNHFVPLLFLNIEWWMNGFTFNCPDTLKLFVFEAFMYCATNYMGSWVMGYPIYYFLTFNNTKSAIVIGGIIGM
jgi:hypothetical protein